LKGRRGRGAFIVSGFNKGRFRKRVGGGEGNRWQRKKGNAVILFGS